MKTKTEKEIDEKYSTIQQIQVVVTVHQQDNLDELATIFADYHRLPYGNEREKIKEEFIKAYKFIICMNHKENLN